MDHSQRAAEQFGSHIADNVYPGRGLVVGRSQAGGWLLLYWIMGRSPHSQNRRFVVDGKTLRTEPVDVSKVEDPSLIIYEAMLELSGVQLVSNGDQTRTAATELAGGGDFASAMLRREREPDAPNYTPRIAAMLDFRGELAEPALHLCLLKAGAFNPAETDRLFFRPATPPAGFGVGLTTYMGDGQPLPSFRGDPLVLPMAGSPQAIVDRYYDALNADNRVAVAVKETDNAGQMRTLLVRNRHT